MNSEQLSRMKDGKGFIAALDQSGGSTPKALKAYGIAESAYNNEEEMFDLVHQMRTRIIKSPSFDKAYILGAILFENTMDRKIDNLYSSDFLWEKKGVVPFLKVDKGLAAEQDDVQLMKDFKDTLPELLNRAKARNIFGTKMRSVIKEANSTGISKIVQQQFEIGKIIAEAGFVPILEPEVDIHSKTKVEVEKLLKAAIKQELAKLEENVKLMFKLTIPTIDDFYQELMDDPRVVRVVALSGGYSQAEANAKLAKNHGLIASFSRALAQDLAVEQSEDEFNKAMQTAVKSIFAASVS